MKLCVRYAANKYPWKKQEIIEAGQKNEPCGNRARNQN